VAAESALGDNALPPRNDFLNAHGDETDVFVSAATESELPLSKATLNLRGRP